jgi:hypothetical protein
MSLDPEDMDAKTRIENNCFLDPNWTPQNDCIQMPVPDMIKHVYKNRKSEAVAPNGNTTPFLTIEEWTRIYKWVIETETKIQHVPV